MKLHERLKAIRSSRIAPSERHLITVIACYLGEHDDGPAYPSVTTMAKETGYAESQVHNLLRSMLASGLIAREEGGKRALLTFIRWDVLSTHVAAPSGRGGVRAKAPKTAPHTPKTAPIGDAAPPDDGCKDWCHEGAEIGGWGAETGATPAKTAPDQFMIRPEISPEEQTRDAREPTAAQPDDQPTEPPMHKTLTFTQPDGSPLTIDVANMGEIYAANSRPPEHVLSIVVMRDGTKHGACEAWQDLARQTGLWNESTDKPHADEVTDAIPTALCPASDDGLRSTDGGGLRAVDGIATGRTAPDRRAGPPVEPGQHVSQPGAVSGRPETPSVEAGDPWRAAGDTSTVTRCGARSDRGGMTCEREPGHNGLHTAGPFAFGEHYPMTHVDEVVFPSTPVAAPATSPLFAPPSLGLPGFVARHEDQGAAGASKPKRGKGKQSDEQIAAIAAQVDRMMGRTGCALPGSGRWKQLVSAVNEAGAARVLDRVTAMADAAQGLPSPAAAIFADMAGSKYGTDPILRGHNFWTIKVDDALDASALGQKRAYDTPSDGGRVDSRPSGASAPQASQAVSWPDVLRDIGSDPQHHPDDGPHREAWQRVRQAVLVSIRKPGDPWLVFCNADDRARQNVERLLVGGLVK